MAEEMYEFEGPVSESPNSEPIQGVDWGTKTASRKTTRQKSPYERRELIKTRQDGAGGLEPVVIPACEGIHAAKSEGVIAGTWNKLFNTKKQSGVIAVGAESVTVVKTFKPEEFRIGLQDYIDGDLED